MKKPLVYIIILNWNSWERTDQCLQSVANLHYENSRTLVVDNGSKDNSRHLLQRLHPRVPCIPVERNRGFSGGNNVGIMRAIDDGAEFVWLLNNDTRVSEHALDTLVESTLEDPRVAAVGSILMGDEGETVEVWGGGTVSFWTGLPRSCSAEVAMAELDYISGASMLLRTSALEEVGLLDEGYFLYWEDTDLSFRLRRAGWKLAVAPGAMVRHRASSSLGFQSPEYDYHFSLSSRRFFRKNFRYSLFPISAGLTGRALKRLACGKRKNVAAIWRAARVPLADR